MDEMNRKLSQGDNEDIQSEERGRIGWKMLSLLMGALLAIPGGWLLATQTFEPGISLSSASAYFENYERTVMNPATRRTAWDTMVTRNYQKYGGFHSDYRRYSQFWGGQQKQPSIRHISKDGKNTFAVSLVFFSKDRGDRPSTRLNSDFAAVFVCDDWKAKWTFKECESSSLRLDDTKHYDFRVVQG